MSIFEKSFFHSKPGLEILWNRDCIKMLIPKNELCSKKHSDLDQKMKTQNASYWGEGSKNDQILSPEQGFPSVDIDIHFRGKDLVIFSQNTSVGSILEGHTLV